MNRMQRFLNTSSRAFLLGCGIGIALLVFNVARGENSGGVAQAAPKAKAPIPKGPETQAARQAIRKQFQVSVVGDDERAQVGLANLLLREADKESIEISERYALLVEAQVAARKALNAELAAKVVKAIDEHFEIDATRELAESLAQISGDIKENWHADSAARVLDEAVKRRIVEDDLDGADILLKVQERLVARMRLGDAARNAGQYRDFLTTALVERRKARAGLQTLANKPNDATASLAVGRYACLVRNDWETGVPYLSHATPGPLERIAAAELAAANDPHKALDAARLLRAASRDEKPLARACLSRRARVWYLKALEASTEAERPEAEGMLRIVELEMVRDNAYVPLETGEPFPIVRSIDEFFALLPRESRSSPIEYAKASEDKARRVDDAFSQLLEKNRVGCDISYKVSKAWAQKDRKEAKLSIQPQTIFLGQQSFLFVPWVEIVSDPEDYDAFGQMMNRLPKGEEIRVIGVLTRNNCSPSVNVDGKPWRGVYWKFVNPVVMKGQAVIYQPSVSDAGTN